MSEKNRNDAGPSDREIEAAMRWVAEQAGPLGPLNLASNHQCAIAAVIDWYERNRDVVAALEAWHARHREWYALTDPTVPTPEGFFEAHTAMAAAWGRVVKVLEARDRR